MKKLGLYSFFIGILMIVFYSVNELFKASDVAIWVKIAMTLIITGIILILVNQLRDRRKEKEEEHDSSQY